MSINFLFFFLKYLAIFNLYEFHPSVMRYSCGACPEGGYPYEIISLMKGYSTNSDQGKQKRAGSSTLVKGSKNVIVDTGNPFEKEKLLKALDESNTSPNDIHYVVCTHCCLDHAGNLNLFPDAKFLVSNVCMSKRGVYDCLKTFPIKIDHGLKVVRTPGIFESDMSVIVENTRHGTVAITGDLFKNEGDLSAQGESRKMILNLADFIVPGHGTMFRNTEKYTHGNMHTSLPVVAFCIKMHVTSGDVLLPIRISL
ncbi:metallo-beta-lactamase domain-containing protein 1-like [Dendronephthya gigantea]|uniref:metallo-beta-lactamase domain-containing protein 1-like n=1 Tax=Dendronephthya gigantea TaxID=151771 RepID=UPI00106A42B3|nr:metallo-beta-lactamase domain-containing protein 1-like [Dendronephthya gigantea]